VIRRQEINVAHPPPTRSEDASLSEGLREILAQHDQLHLFEHWLTLPDQSREALAGRLSQIDFAELRALALGHEAKEPWHDLARRAEPPPAIRLVDAANDPADSQTAAESRARAAEPGEKALAAGEIGIILVAGGQGTRLGFRPPKGLLPIGPVSGRTLFQMLVDQLLAIGRRYGRAVPLLIMTSPATDGQTRAYFESHGRLGLTPENLHIFQQSTLPALDARTGRVLLAEPGVVAESPDGHGGLIAALEACSLLDRMLDRGIKHFFYCQVDNPLVQVCDPVMLGHHIAGQADVSLQAVAKRHPLQRVGNIVSIDGRVRIIEYSDLPDDAAQARLPDGSLKLWAGSIAVHCFGADFLKRCAGRRDALPLHRALKKVEHLGPDGRTICPDAPNAYKFERFIFDLLAVADRTVVTEVDPDEAFAPVKNAAGEDSPDTTRAALSARARRWLRRAGAEVREGVPVEIHPDFAIDVEELRCRIRPGTRVDAPTLLR
jgi:UDP-N-acetylglucosamine/UDP-N-acetylgalactosamine diphosphorylase